MDVEDVVDSVNRHARVMTLRLPVEVGVVEQGGSEVVVVKYEDHDGDTFGFHIDCSDYSQKTADFMAEHQLDKMRDQLWKKHVLQERE